jgi:hypothetical protein
MSSRLMTKLRVGRERRGSERKSLGELLEGCSHCVQAPSDKDLGLLQSKLFLSYFSL